MPLGRPSGIRVRFANLINAPLRGTTKNISARQNISDRGNSGQLQHLVSAFFGNLEEVISHSHTLPHLTRNQEKSLKWENALSTGYETDAKSHVTRMSIVIAQYLERNARYAFFRGNVVAI